MESTCSSFSFHVSLDKSVSCLYHCSLYFSFHVSLDKSVSCLYHCSLYFSFHVSLDKSVSCLYHCSLYFSFHVSLDKSVSCLYHCSLYFYSWLFYYIFKLLSGKPSWMAVLRWEEHRLIYFWDVALLPS